MAEALLLGDGPPVDLGPLDAELAREALAQLGLEDVAGGDAVGRRADEPLPLEPDVSVVPGAGCAGVALEVVERGPAGAAGRLPHGPGDLGLAVVVGERPERRDGLRDGHLEVDALHRVRAGRSAELVACCRVAALEQSLEVAVLELACEVEPGRSLAGPGAGRLAPAGVVVLGPVGRRAPPMRDGLMNWSNPPGTCGGSSGCPSGPLDADATPQHPNVG